MKTLDTVGGISGVWPDAQADDNAVAGVGTALEESWLSDLFGFMQAALYGGCGVGVGIAANVAPSGGIESKTVSQLLAALRAHCGNAGEIVAWSGPVIPAGVRLIELQGQLIHVADYPELVMNTYCGDAQNANPLVTAFYKCTGAGVKDIAGDHFRLPDARGYFLRGIAQGTTVDPEANRKSGSVQTESIKQHNHDGLRSAETMGNNLRTHGGGGADFCVDLMAATGGVIATTSTGTAIGTGTANETRPDNIAVFWCIRY